VIVNATPGDTSVERLGEMRDMLAGKILIDIANATVRGESDMPGGLLYPETSLAEELQKALPDTKVVKTLNTMLFTVMADPGSLRSPATAFLSGNHTDAKERVCELLVDLGWQADQIEDLGGIASARAVEPFILLVPTILKKYGFAPFALSLAR
jgi:predicted dinucleotide-binding enzyme